MITFLFISILLSVTVAANAESAQVDELLTKFDSSPAREQWEVSNAFFDYLYDEEFTDDYIHFYDYHKPDTIRMTVWYWAAEWFKDNAEYSKAVTYCKKTIPLAKGMDEELLSDTYNLLGMSYFRLSEFEKAAEAFDACYEIDKRANDPDRLSSTLNSIAGVYYAMKQPKEAEQYILEAIAVNSLTDNTTRRAVLYGTASEIYNSMQDYTQSLRYAQSALQIERQLGRQDREGMRLSQMAKAYIGLKQYDDAKEALETAISLLTSNPHSAAITQSQLGDVYLLLEDTTNAIEHFTIASEMFRHQGDLYNELHAQTGLYNSLKQSSPQEAMLHLERCNLIRDSIFTAETGDAISRYNAQYGNDLLLLDKQHNEERNHRYAIFAIISLILLISIVLVVWADMRRRHRTVREVYQNDIQTLRGQYEQLNTWYQNAIQQNEKSADELKDDEKEFMDKLASVVNDELDHGSADVETVASKLNLSVVQLRKRLADIAQETPQNYILNLRMQKAKHLLETNRDMPISEVGMRCGYEETSNFTRAFRRHFGISPSTYRKPSK